MLIHSSVAKCISRMQFAKLPDAPVDDEQWHLAVDGRILGQQVGLTLIRPGMSTQLLVHVIGVKFS